MKKKLKFTKAQNFKIPSTDGKIFELNKIKNKYILNLIFWLTKKRRQ